MSAYATLPRPVKPVGGIEGVRLIPAEAVVAVVSDGEGLFRPVIREGAAAVEWPLLEERSFYREETTASEGGPLVRHVLSLAAPEEAALRVEAQELLRWAVRGAVACIETSSGQVLLVGWSETFGTERPLLLASASRRTESRAIDRPVFEVVFVCEDTAPAVSCSERIEEEKSIETT